MQLLKHPLLQIPRRNPQELLNPTHILVLLPLPQKTMLYPGEHLQLP